MDWADEQYVKLYVRPTATRQLWPWQAKALHPNLLMVLDKAGILDVGTQHTVRNIALLVGLPIDVVKPGLDALIEDGTIELNGGKVVMPKFVEAQEARKTEAAKARDYRMRRRDKERSKPTDSQDPTVTARHRASPDVTARHPPALPCPTPALPGSDLSPDPAEPESDPDGEHRKVSAQGGLWLEMEACRIERCKELDLAPGKSKRPEPAAINAILLRAVEHLGFVDRVTPHGSLTRWDQLGELYEFFLSGDFGRDGTPPYPIELFCSNGVLDTTRRKMEAAPRPAEATA
jgi:hypothetical protein